MTTHIVSLSGGTASAVAADRVLSRYGSANTILWFADTSWEDEDLYRFLVDLEAYWEKKIVRYTDGRTPLQVAEDASIIPNQRRAPCALVLKIVPFRKMVESTEKPVTVHLGLDWTEEHRMARPKAEYESIEGVTVDFPLNWEPLPPMSYARTVADWGIQPPRLYAMGFPHNNCGGRCVKQGLKEWLRLKKTMPERFVEVRDWERDQRAKGGARGSYAIARDQSGGKVKALPLSELEEKAEKYGYDKIDIAPTDGDAFGCFCSY